MSTKRLKNDHKREHTSVVMETIGTGKAQHTVRKRVPDGTSLKEYARAHKDGADWFRRKRGE